MKARPSPIAAPSIAVEGGTARRVARTSTWMYSVDCVGNKQSRTRAIRQPGHGWPVCWTRPERSAAPLAHPCASRHWCILPIAGEAAWGGLLLVPFLGRARKGTCRAGAKPRIQLTWRSHTNQSFELFGPRAGLPQLMRQIRRSPHRTLRKFRVECGNP